MSTELTRAPIIRTKANFHQGRRKVTISWEVRHSKLREIKLHNKFTIISTYVYF